MTGKFQVLTTTQAIQQKISLYLGSSDTDGVFQSFKEVADNCLDEYNEGRVTNLGVIINKDNEVIVYDNGGGIPIENHHKTGKPIIQEAFTSLHAGGKFKDGLYIHGTRGTHGLGAKATNAVSTYFEVWTHRSNKWYNIRFEKGKVKTELNKESKPPIKLSNGTIIKFKINTDLFDKGSKLPLNKIKSFLILQSYICKGLKIYLKTPKNEYTFYHKDGLTSLIDKKLKENPEAEELGKRFTFSNGAVDLALTWTKASEEMITSYVSGSYTINGGTHLNGLYDALRDATKEYKGKKEFSVQDLLAGTIGVLNVAVVEPKFTSQSKEQLSKVETRKEVYDLVKPELEKFFASNKSLTKLIISKAQELNTSRAKFMADKKSISALKSKEGKALLSGKLAKSLTKDPTIREIFLVEGASAAGTATFARDKWFQEVLPLRGKILNAYKKEDGKVFANGNVQDIFRSINYELGEKNPSAKLRVGRIILLTDPDVDGKHISNLILSLFQKISPELFEQKRIFTVNSELFNIQIGTKKIFGRSVEDIRAKLKIAGLKEPTQGQGIQRVKGWAEIKVDTLREVAFDKKTRKLTRITALEGKEIGEFSGVVGEDASIRRKLLGL